MRELIGIYRSGDKEIRIFKSKRKVRAEVYTFKPFAYQNVFNDRICLDVEAFLKLDGERRMLESLGITSYYKVPFERKNGRLVLFPVNKQKRVIWTNDDYAEWCDAMAEEITEEEITPEYYGFCCETNLADERMNLNKEVDGCIVVFASLGLWNGRRKGKAIVGTNVKDILNSDCDYVTWYCDPYNVRCDATHHDGTNHYLYRVAESREAAERLVDSGCFDEEKFRRATKSLRPYVAEVYGW